MARTWLRTMRQPPIQANGTVAHGEDGELHDDGAPLAEEGVVLEPVTSVGDAGPEGGRDGEHEDERGQAGDDLADAHDGRVHPAAAVAREQPQAEPEEEPAGEDDDEL